MDKTLIARVGKQAWFHRYPVGWPLLLFFMTFAVTALAIAAIERADSERLQLELDRNVTEIASGLQRRAAENSAFLAATATLMEARDQISFDEFASFVRGLYSNENYRGTLGLGWAPRISSADTAAFELAMRESADPEFRIQQQVQPGQGVVVPIVYLAPLTPTNRLAIGYDMYSEPERRAAMDRAARLGQPVATGKVALRQDRGDIRSPGFLIYMPVYERTATARRLKGFVYSPFRANEFLDSAAALYRSRGVEIALFDGEVSDPMLLAERRLPGASGAAIVRPITVANHKWVLRVAIKDENRLTPLSLAVLFFGLTLAIVLGMVARNMTRRAEQDRAVLEYLARQSAIRNSLTRELNHRVKNTLANVLSIVALTRRRAKSLDEFAESLSGRIRALSATHDLLSQTDWSNAPIREVIRSELAPYMGTHPDNPGESHVDFSGPDISLAPNDALSLGLAVHELATNAAKYGAFSTGTGRVILQWKLLTPELAEVNWREEGGPPVSEPPKRGFGRDLIEKIVAQELKSRIDLEFRPEGVVCRLHVPVRKLSDFNLRAAKPDPADRPS